LRFVKAPANGPNVLIVLIDDMGFGQSSAFGGPIHMPTVGALANDGESCVCTAIVRIFNVGSTAAIGAIEFEPGLKQDLPALLRRLIPPSRGLCPRANLARRQLPFPPASDAARSEPDGARARRPARARHLAADFSH